MSISGKACAKDCIQDFPLKIDFLKCRPRREAVSFSDRLLRPLCAGRADPVVRAKVTGKKDMALNAGEQATASRAHGLGMTKECSHNTEMLNPDKNECAGCDDFAMSLLPGASAHKHKSGAISFR